MSVTIAATFEELRRKRRIGLMPFIPAGWPDLETTAEVLPALEAGGADVIEVGIPFSDPIADGPVIQQAFTDALARKLKLADIFGSIASVRSRLAVPLVAMVSYSIVFRSGVEKFVKEAKAAGFDGLIVPDLPPPEAQAVCGTIRAGGLDTILLVAPTTAPERRSEIARLCSGFVYCLSISGVTGVRQRLPTNVSENVRQIKNETHVPVCVGFGISRREQVEQLAGVADGAIVGSAFVKRMQERAARGRQAVAEAVRTYCQELAGAVG